MTLIRLIIAFILSAYCFMPEVFAADYQSFYHHNKNKSSTQLTKAGYSMLEDEKYEEAMAYFTLAAEKWDDAVDERDKINSIVSMTNIGYIYLFHYHSQETAYNWLLKAQNLAEHSGIGNMSHIMPVIYDNIAKIYDDFGDHSKAISLYEESFHKAIGKAPRITVNKIFIDYVTAALLNDNTSGLDSIINSFSCLPDSDAPLSGYLRHILEGLKAFNAGNFSDCDSIFTNAAGYIDTDTVRYSIVNHLLNAKINIIGGEIEKSRKALESAESTVVADSRLDLLPRIYTLFAEGYEKERNTDKEREFRTKVLEINDSLYNASNFGKIKDIESSRRIDDLHNDIREAMIVQRHRLTVIWILAVTVLVIAAMAVVIFRRNRDLRQSNKTLVSRNRQQIDEQRLQARLRKELEEKIESLEERLSEKESGQTEENSRRSSRLPLDRNDILQLVIRINDFLDNSEEVYSPDFSMERMAEILGCKSNYLSHVINNEMNRNFSSLISETRIRRACELILDPVTSKSLTLDAIAEKVGYRSRTHFSSVFKKVTGVSPSRYEGISRQQKNSSPDIDS